MTLNLEHPTIALDRGQVVSLDDAAGSLISARNGTVWVTFENSGKDVIVAPGESVVISRDGRTVVQALESAFVSIQ
jgi:hypothetical protein